MSEKAVPSKPRKAPAKKPVADPKPAARVAPVKVATNKAAAAGQDKPAKDKKGHGKLKVVRDSFTMPQVDYDKIAELKQICRKAGLQVKKSELLRAGLLALSKLSLLQLERAIVQLTPIKTGRPKKA